jgi:biotin carboxylase
MMLPEMVYVLSSPRSGSTLLRVMLGGHSALFSPPELNLLPFCNMAERDHHLGAAAHKLIDCDQRSGLVEAVMRLARLEAEAAEDWVRNFVERQVPTRSMYQVLRGMAAPRRLVDKSTLNASSPDFLFKSTCVTPGARYIYLMRHPYATIDSLIRMYYSQLPADEAFEAAQTLWRIPNENILSFLSSLDRRQHFTLPFERLVKEPARVTEELSRFLGVSFEPSMLAPYEGDRMTRGPGDPNFDKHTTIDPRLGEAWRTAELRYDIDCSSRALSTFLGYETFTKSAGRARRSASASERPEVVLVVPPFSYRTQAYVAAAKKLGLKTTIALDPAYGVPEGVDGYLPVSFERRDCSAQLIASHVRANGASAIVSTDDGAVDLAAMAAQELGLPHNPVHAIQATNDKHAMRILLERAGVPSPAYRHHWMCEEPRRIAARLDYPVVLKPLYLSGSRGVMRANNPEEFVTAFYRLARLLEQPGTGPEPKSFLVEDYVPGVEVSMEGIFVDGKLWPLGIYDKPDPLEGPFFEETLLITPSRLATEVQDRIARVAEQALQAVGLRVGPVHVELRCNERGPWIVELAARTMGGHCSRALPFRNGFTLEDVILSHAVGLDVKKFERTDGAHGVMMIPIPGEGILRRVNGIPAAESVPNVSGVMITIEEGEIITPLPEGHKYMGFIFAHGETPDGVESSLRRAHGCLSFDLDAIARIRLHFRPDGGLTSRA